jgi:hypothetical protein
MLGIYIHGMKDSNGAADTKGANPLDNWQVERDGRTVLLSSLYPTYDWVNEDGRKNMAAWIETAAKKAGK